MRGAYRALGALIALSLAALPAQAQTGAVGSVARSAYGRAVTAKATADAATTLATGARPSVANSVVPIGDSRTARSIRYNLNSNSSDEYDGHGFYTMLLALSGGRLQPVSPTGWPQVSGASAGGVAQILIAKPGRGYTNPTLTVPTNTGCSGVTLGAPVLDANGGFVSVPVTANGASCVNAPLITISDATGSGAQLLAQTNAAGGLAASGIGTSEALAYVPPACATGAKNALTLIGTNDLGRYGYTPAQSATDKLSMLQGLANCGMRSIVVAELDRNGASGTQNKKQNLANRLNDLRLASKVPGTIVCDPSPYLTDPNTGDVLPNVYADGQLHFAWYGAYLAAKACWSQIAPFFTTPAAQTIQSATWDAYDATYNLAGNLIAQPLVATGTATAVTAGEAPWTGTRPANVQLARVSTATGTVNTLSAAQVARVDGRPGTSLRLTIDVSGATAGDVYRLIWTPSNGSMTSATLGVGGANTLQIGQTIVGTVDDAYVTKSVGVRAVKLKLVDLQLSSTISPTAATIGNYLRTAAWGDTDDDTFPSMTNDHLWLQTRQLTLPANSLAVTFMMEFVAGASAMQLTIDLSGASVRYAQ